MDVQFYVLCNNYVKLSVVHNIGIIDPAVCLRIRDEERILEAFYYGLRPHHYQRVQYIVSKDLQPRINFCEGTVTINFLHLRYIQRISILNNFQIFFTLRVEYAYGGNHYKKSAPCYLPQGGVEMIAHHFLATKRMGDCDISHATIMSRRAIRLPLRRAPSIGLQWDDSCRRALLIHADWPSFFI